MAKKTNGYELEIKFPNGSVIISVNQKGNVPDIYIAYFAHLITEKLNSVEASFKNQDNDKNSEHSQLQPGRSSRREKQPAVNDNPGSSNDNTGNNEEVRPGTTDRRENKSPDLGEYGGSPTRSLDNGFS